ncbi:MAG TPA: hypothetical protein VFI59_14415 [Actinomycetota bacterium]|nr:hypothetical protein [Actinomycetota bacterium]
MHANEERMRDLPLRDSPNDGRERSNGQRSYGHPARTHIEGALQAKWIRQPGRFSQRGHDADRLPIETANRERQGLGGGTVDPLHIVDREDYRLGSGHGLQRAKDRDRDASPVGPLPATLRAQQRDVELPALRRRQRIGDLVQRVADQVAERRVGEARLGLDRAGGQDSVVALPNRGHSRLPDHSFADPRRTCYEEPASA